MKPLRIEEQDLKKIFTKDTPTSKFLRTLGRITKQTIYLALVFVLFFVLLNFGAFYQQYKYLAKGQPNTPVKVAITAPTTTPPNYSPAVEIPKIGITAPIVMNIPIDQIDSHLEEGVVHTDGSAEPGQVGNVVIFGHSSDYPWKPGNFHNIFALLDKLSVGDQIAVPYKDQKFIYQVTGSKVVPPTDLSVIQKTDQPTLTLITCYPVGTSNKRLVITATLVSGQTTGTQQASPSVTSIPSSR